MFEGGEGPREGNGARGASQLEIVPEVVLDRVHDHEAGGEGKVVVDAEAAGEVLPSPVAIPEQVPVTEAGEGQENGKKKSAVTKTKWDRYAFSRTFDEVELLSDEDFKSWVDVNVELLELAGINHRQLGELVSQADFRTQLETYARSMNGERVGRAGEKLNRDQVNKVAVKLLMASYIFGRRSEDVGSRGAGTYVNGDLPAAGYSDEWKYQIDAMMDYGEVREMMKRYMTSEENIHRAEIDSLMEAWLKVIENGENLNEACESDHNLNDINIQKVSEDALGYEYLKAVVGNDTSRLYAEVMGRLEKLAVEQKVEVVVDKFDNLLIMRSSLSDLYGDNSVVLDRLKELGLNDLPLSIMVPLSKEEVARWGNVDDKVALGQLALRAFSGAERICYGGHGYGATREVWENVAHELTGFDEEKRNRLGADGREIMLAFSNKGAESTAIKKEAGLMPNGSMQILTGLRALGLVGRKEGEIADIVWYGHSMGGQEALLGMMLSNHDWENMHFMPITPVVNNDIGHLRLIQAINPLKDPVGALRLGLKNLPGYLTGMSLKIPLWLGDKVDRAIIGRRYTTILPERIYEKLTNAGDATRFYSYRFIMGVAKGVGLQNYVMSRWGIEGKQFDVHSRQVIMLDYITGVYLGLIKSMSMKKVVAPLVNNRYDKRLIGVPYSNYDRVLRGEDMKEELQPLEHKLYRAPDNKKWPHYIFGQKEGARWLRGLVDAYFEPVKA